MERFTFLLLVIVIFTCLITGCAGKNIATPEAKAFFFSADVTIETETVSKAIPGKQTPIIQREVKNIQDVFVSSIDFTAADLVNLIASQAIKIFNCRPKDIKDVKVIDLTRIK